MNVRRVDEWMAEAEGVLVAIFGRIASWVANVPVAVMTARAVQRIFDIGQAWAIITAVALELVGMGTSRLWASGKEWNARKRAADVPARTGLALAMMVVYFAADFILVGILTGLNIHETGEWEYLAALLFPIMALVGVLVLNERVQNHARAEKAQEERDEAKAERAQAKAERAQAKAERDDATQGASQRAQAVTLAAANATHSGNGAAHDCPYCGAEYRTSQAVSAHLRFCAAYRAQKCDRALEAREGVGR